MAGQHNVDNVLRGSFFDPQRSILMSILLTPFSRRAVPAPPAAYNSQTVATGETSFRCCVFEPGYYLLCADHRSKQQPLKPTTVFVQAKKTTKLKFFAGGNNVALTAPYSVTLKSENAPTVDKKVEEARAHGSPRPAPKPDRP